MPRLPHPSSHGKLALSLTFILQKIDRDIRQLEDEKSNGPRFWQNENSFYKLKQEKISGLSDLKTLLVSYKANSNEKEPAEVLKEIEMIKRQYRTLCKGLDSKCGMTINNAICYFAILAEQQKGEFTDSKAVELKSRNPSS